MKGAFQFANTKYIYLTGQAIIKEHMVSKAECERPFR